MQGAVHRKKLNTILEKNEDSFTTSHIHSCHKLTRLLNNSNIIESRIDGKQCRRSLSGQRVEKIYAFEFERDLVKTTIEYHRASAHPSHNFYLHPFGTPAQSHIEIIEDFDCIVSFSWSGWSSATIPQSRLCRFAHRISSSYPEYSLKKTRHFGLWQNRHQYR